MDRVRGAIPTDAICVAAWFAWTLIPRQWHGPAISETAITVLCAAVYLCARARAWGPLCVALCAALVTSWPVLVENGNLRSEWAVALVLFSPPAWPLALAAALVSSVEGCARSLAALACCWPWKGRAASRVAVAAALILYVKTMGPWDYVEKICGRGEIWKAGIASWREAPVFGHGPGSIGEGLALHQTGGFWAIWPDMRFAAHAQNDIIEIAVQHGGIGLLLWIAVLASHRVWRHPAALAVCLMGLAGFPLHIPATATVFWTSLGTGGNSDALT